MAREDIKQLYAELVESRFGFMPTGSHELKDIYQFVNSRFSALCDSNFLCIENCSNGNNSPEWQHAIRKALGKLKDDGVVSGGDDRGVWVFG